jgi:hypothetical protein
MKQKGFLVGTGSALDRRRRIQMFDSDLTKFKKMFDKARISFEEYTHTKEITVGSEKRLATQSNGESFELDWPIKEVVFGGTSLAVAGGYSGFYSTIVFDENDNLVSVEAYE